MIVTRKFTEVVFVLALVSSHADAATFTYNNNGNQNSVAPRTVDGITLSFSAPLENQDVFFANSTFVANNRGVGVRTAGGDDPSDAVNQGETLRLNFDTLVAGTTLTTGRWGDGDSLTLTSDTGASLFLDANDNSGNLEPFDISALGNFTYLDLSSNVIGTDGSTLHAINVSAVPLPAAAWLLGSALLSLLGVSRRRLRAVS